MNALTRHLALAAGAGMVVLLVCLSALASCGASSSVLLSDNCAGSGFTPPSGDGTAFTEALHRWDADQVAHAATIIGVGRDKDVPAWGAVVAVATAMQESGLRNLPHRGAGNDHDSVGLFQQRPSQGWGTPAQLADPRYAAAAFYDRLRAVPGWEQLPLTEAAQRVQRSAYPHAYARWTADAVTLVAALTPPGTPSGDTGGCPQPAAGGGWTPPVSAPVGSGFRTAQRPGHDGADLPAPRHSTVRAAAAGTVLTVACNAVHVNGHPWGCDRDGDPALTRGCGWYVDITHPGGVITRYCHLHTRPFVHPGQRITTGQPIGVVGSTGHSSGPHLHFEVHTGADASPAGAVDPVPFMAARGAPLT